MTRLLLLCLLLVLTGCSTPAKPAPSGVMPPIAPVVAGEVDATPIGDGDDASWQDVVESADADTGELTASQQLDDLWAEGDWAGIIDLLEGERSNPDSVMSQTTILEKLYAAHINAGYAALRLDQKDEAMTSFLSAMALAPERSESAPGIVVVQDRYLEEAKHVIQELERQRAERQRPQEEPQQQAAQQEESESGG